MLLPPQHASVAFQNWSPSAFLEPSGRHVDEAVVLGQRLKLEVFLDVRRVDPKPCNPSTNGMATVGS